MPLDLEDQTMTTFKALAYIQNIRSIAAEHSMPQPESIAWIMKALQKSSEGSENGDKVSRALNLYEKLLNNESIRHRRSVLPDYMHQDWERMTLFKPSVRSDGSASHWTSPPLQDRMKLYVNAARQMAREAFSNEEKAPAYIVDVSCTGYRAPTPVQELVLEKGWEQKTRLLKIGHMGCYASVPGVHLAVQMAQSIPKDAQVSVLSTEICTLHLNPLAQDPDQIVSNILFADGCARIDVGLDKKMGSLAFLDHYEAIIPESSEYMSWDLEDSRFHMTLSRKVVTQLNKVIGSHLSEFLSLHGLKADQISRFAIHPGGPRIVESIQEELKLPDQAVSHSKAVLASFGNMSSATLPHVWKAMMEDSSVKAGEMIVSMAFGPGLTVTMNLLQKV
jgi:predicted naringenin-chalcone synthase